MNAITFPSVKSIESLRTVSINIVSEETKANALDHLAKVRIAAKQLKADVDALKQPFKDEIQKIDLAAKSWINLLTERDRAVESALIAYNSKMRAAAQNFNAKSMERYEQRVEKNETKAIDAGKTIPLTPLPAMKIEPAKSAHTEEARVTEVEYRTWTGIHGVAGGQEGAKDVTWPEAQRLKLDLPPDWFTLRTALVTACVKRNDRVPACIQVQVEKKMTVTATK